MQRLRAESIMEVGGGQLVDFIPELAAINPNQLGIALMNSSGQIWSAGEAEVGFSIQSISKAIAYIYALKYSCENITRRVRREAAGHAFNSLIRLEEERGIPRNPFVNGGALVVSDILCAIADDPETDLISFVRSLAGNASIQSDRRVSDCEYRWGARNTSIGYLLKSFNNLNYDVEKVLRLYLHNCAINMSCLDLARFFAFLVNDGRCPVSQEQVISPEQVRIVTGLFSTCGLYEESGAFMCEVGVPTKSGVGGGIVGVLPQGYSFCVWSPALNEHGNSVAGLHFIRRLVKGLASFENKDSLT
ncbi:glutaminase A [Pseudomonas putida]|uniref:Glutaminase n=2 Tax=Pseudomonas putida TaxID=303 RepID=A0A8I1JM05_PSEPU|nr:glutaminase A [Pseudomonas putida]